MDILEGCGQKRGLKKEIKSNFKAPRHDKKVYHLLKMAAGTVHRGIQRDGCSG